MAAKKKASKKRSGSSGKKSNGVAVLVDRETLLTLKSVAAAMSDVAQAMIMASDDPAVQGKKKSSAKRAKKRAKAKKAA